MRAASAPAGRRGSAPSDGKSWRGSAVRASGSRRGTGQTQSSRRGSGQVGSDRRGSNQAVAQPVFAVQDVSRLRDVDDQLVTDVLCERYADKRVYTRCGDNVLLLVTPSRSLERYYDEDAKAKYRGGRLHELAPHIYLIGEEAYRRAHLMRSVVPVFIVGESGAGKTEAAKELVRYMLWRSSGEHGGGSVSHRRLAHSIAASFVVFEAFGNARTVVSPNSSRFGQLRRLYVGASGVCGASIRLCSFDKWRVLGPPPGEYNFHAFYSVVEGAPDALRGAIGLPDARGARQFGCLVQGGVHGQQAPTFAGVLGKRDEGASFSALYAALAALGLSDALRLDVLKLVVAILHLNNVDAARMSIHGAVGAAPRAGEPLAQPGAARAARPGSAAERAGSRAALGTAGASSNDKLLRTVCELLGLDARSPGCELRESLLSRSVLLRGEEVIIPHSAQQAEWCRAALSRSLYELLFRWLAAAGNATSGADADAEARARPHAQALGWVELFEMQGAEAVSVRGASAGLELLCANALAEAMHARFLRATFAAPAELLDEEGIAPPALPAPGPERPQHDSARLIDALVRAREDKGGLLALLASLGPRYGGDQADTAARLASAVNRRHAGGGFVRMPRTLAESEAGFTVRHYCREVTYTARSLVARDNEGLPAHLLAVLERSSSSLVRQILQLEPSIGLAVSSDGPSSASGMQPRGRASSNLNPPALGYASAAARFASEINTLLAQAERWPVHEALFVVCLKPAPVVQLAANQCDRGTVLRHVRARGLGAAARVIGPGWAHSLEHAFLHARFAGEMRRTRGLDWRTMASVLTGSASAFAGLLRLAFEVPDSQAANGRSRLFLRGQRGLEFYDLCLSEEAEAVPALRQALLDYTKRRRALETLGPWLLAYNERRQFRLVRQAAIKLQAFARGARVRKAHRRRLELSRATMGSVRRNVKRAASNFALRAIELAQLSRERAGATLRSLFDRAEAEERRQSARLSEMIAGRRSTKHAVAVLSGMVHALEHAARMNDIERRWQAIVEQMLLRHHENSKDYQLMGTYLSRSQSRTARAGSGVGYGGTFGGRGGSNDLLVVDMIGRSNVAALEAELRQSTTTTRRRAEIKAALESSSFNAGLREMVRYVLFLALFLAQLFQYRVADAHDVTAALKRNLHGREPLYFTTLDDKGDMWEWMRAHFAPVIFQSAGSSSDEFGRVLRTSTLIGAVRIAQDRGVVSQQCVVPMYSDAYIGVCYPGYTTTNGNLGHVSSPRSPAIEAGEVYPQSVEPYGVGTARGRPEFKPRRLEQWWRGRRRALERFVLDIRSDSAAEQVLATLDDLQKFRWIDVQTRTLDLLFTTYTPSADVFTAVDLQVRFPETGGIRGFAYYRPFVVDRHWLVFDRARTLLFPALSSDFAMLVNDVLFYCLVIVQYAQELTILRVRGAAEYFRQPWSLLELLNMSLFVATFAMRVKLNAELVASTKWAPGADEYVDFLSVGEAKHTIQWLTAINCLLSFIKVFKYVTISPNLSLLNSTITSAADELFTFCILFVFVFLAFTQAFTIAFSSQLAECMDFGSSFVSLWLIVIGVFDFKQFQEVSPVFGPLFFISFVIIVFFCFINFFIAIVTGQPFTPIACMSARPPAPLDIRLSCCPSIHHQRANLAPAPRAPAFWLAAATEAYKAVKLAKKKAADSGADPLAIVIRNG